MPANKLICAEGRQNGTVVKSTRVNVLPVKSLFNFGMWHMHEQRAIQQMISRGMSKEYQGELGMCLGLF